MAAYSDLPVTPRWLGALLLAIPLSWSAVLGGCAAEDKTPTAGGTADVAATDVTFGQGDVGLDAQSAPESDSGGNPKDMPDILIGLGDTASATDVGADTASGGGVAWICEGTGEAGCPCKANADCNSGHCIDTPDKGLICTTECQNTCPDGFICVAEGGTDVAYLCRPKWPVLCNPCDADADCSAVGVGKSLCVDRGPLGKFCGAACAGDLDCPASYTCQSVTSAGGKTGAQCMPAADQGKPFDCACSFSAKLAKLGTSCAAAAGQSGKPGTLCAGVRQCGDAGLSACSALSSPEVCNGKDDDCDGDIDEGSCEDYNACTTDFCNPATLACGHTDTVGACDADNNACTEGDACQSGKCTAGQPKKCDDGNPCTLDTCDIAKGCTATLDDGAGCDDGNPCSVGDVCGAGQCQPGKPKVCPSAAACQTVACSAASGKCESSNQADATACSDESACTEADACKGGFCVGTPINCDDSNLCTLDSCDSGSGCKHAPATVPCDDGNACTGSDTCTGGSCIGSPKAKCDDANPCTDDSCDPKQGCVATANSASCDDANACTVGDTCKASACVPGTSTCQCQQDADCKDDGNLCNGTMFCDKTLPGNFQCKTNPATVVVCSPASDTACAVATCQPATGKCAPAPVVDGKPCNADYSVCTMADSCKAGVCVPGTPLPCDDGNPCTTDACDAINGCAHQANSGPCDADANGCTGPDSCKGGFCFAGPPLGCDDGTPCTVDSCDKATGTCVHDGPPADGFACDADGSVCTTPDLCVGGACKPGAAKNCDDLNPCTADNCEFKLGCQHTTVTDKSGCGTGKWCMAGSCVKAPNCGDGVLDPGEECDDANQIAGDGCTNCLVDKPPQAKVGEVIITEVMAAPFTQSEEWVEVLNISDHTVDLNGLLFGDAQFYITLAKTGGFYVKPGQYALLSAVDISKTGGPKPDYVYGYDTGGVAFNNNGDAASLCMDVNCTAGKVFSNIVFGKQVAALSYQLNASTMTAAGAANAANWCSAKSAMANGKDKGTPQAVNTTCP